MRTYAWREVFHDCEVDTWESARALVERVQFDDCRCHELARAVHRVLVCCQDEFVTHDLVPRVEDGMVGFVEHSWIRLWPRGRVLDVYRPGVVPGVLLVDRLVAHDYRPGPTRSDIRDSDVDRLVAEMARPPRASIRRKPR